jgi:hypothetical protein
VDPSDRIYVSDSANNRIVRINDMTGTGWTTLGAYGTGRLQFNGGANAQMGNIFSRHGRENLCGGRRERPPSRDG